MAKKDLGRTLATLTVVLKHMVSQMLYLYWGTASPLTDWGQSISYAGGWVVGTIYLWKISMHMSVKCISVHKNACFSI